MQIWLRLRYLSVSICKKKSANDPHIHPFTTPSHLKLPIDSESFQSSRIQFFVACIPVKNTDTYQIHSPADDKNCMRYFKSWSLNSLCQSPKAQFFSSQSAIRQLVTFSSSGTSLRDRVINCNDSKYWYSWFNTLILVSFIRFNHCVLAFALRFNF